MDSDSEDCRIYIVRKPDQKEWMAKAQSGDEVAKLCLWAASNLMKDIAKEPIHCGCCEALSEGGDVPQAFIVLVPVERDPEKARAHSMGVCGQCSRQDDRWLVEQGPKRKGLSLTGPRGRDKIH